MTSEQKANVERYLDSKSNGSNGRCRRRIDGEKVECGACGSKNQLEWHHRKYWSEGGTDEPENLCVLCYRCHVQEHKKRNDFRLAGRWGGLVSAYVREKRLGRKRFCEYMRNLAMKKACDV